MSYYRYSASYLAEDQQNTIAVRSLIPFPHEPKEVRHYCHRYYTSEKDDSKNIYVISLGHECTFPNTDKPPRVVDRFIMHYVVKGNGYYNGLPVSANQFFFSKPYEGHVISTDPLDPMEFYYIGISGPGTQELMERVGFLSIPCIHDFSFADQIPALFEEILYRTHPECDTELFLLGQFLRLMAMHKEELSHHTSEDRSGSFVYYKEALLFIQEYLLDGITPRDVAQYLHISPSYLRVIFAKHCRYSLRELLIRKRMECAASHLTNNGCTVQQAANLVGYDDYTLFSKIFKKYTGMTPQKYRMEHDQKALKT